eukprot:7387783-Prymnesium_polylepis.2
MAGYLTYEGSDSLAASGTDPDENYAREIMQLFTIGPSCHPRVPAWHAQCADLLAPICFPRHCFSRLPRSPNTCTGLKELNPDGSYELNAAGEPIETYGTANIKEFAKLWTGFNRRPDRGNMERGGHVRGNRIDPLKIDANGHSTKRDLFPVMDLHDGYIGDSVPLCSDLPERHFLSKGARWSFLGHSPTAQLQPEALSRGTINALDRVGWTNGVPRVVLNASASSLYQKLCSASGLGSACTFASEITLETNFPCHGLECQIDTLFVVDVFDPVANSTVYYEYVRVPCVELTLYNATMVKAAPFATSEMCADPSTESAAAACCPPTHDHTTVAQTIASL